uniref:HD/PDEase domain-containing protein n=1 Tax=Peronospora matthiolae TaxID=2874970 RepID=A0AAV1TA72_9STRA
MAPSQLVQRTAAFVKQQLKPNDASHDWHHIERVWTLAKSLAKEERVSEESREIVDLAALLHDIDDWKYRKDPEKPTKRAAAFLESENVPSDKIACVMAIIDSMGYKEELAGENKQPHSIEYGCVQDADRLDAIGAIGIARCFTMTKEQYMDPKRPNTTINHFYEKLLKLRGMMKTDAGKRLADERHAFMETFLTQFHNECSGRK